MSDTRDIPVESESPRQPGPSLLTERTLTGIFVHLIGLLTAFIGPLLIYAASSHEFTQRNARNAANWQLFYFATVVVAILLFGVVFVADLLLPDVIVFVLLLVIFVFVLLMAVLGFLNLAFVLIATGKAIFGGSWEYPITPDRLDIDRSSLEMDIAPWKLTLIYVLIVPVLFGGLGWISLHGAPESDSGFAAFFGLTAITLIVSVFTFVLLYRDLSIVTRMESSWNPSPIAYLATPVAGGIVTYLLATTYYHSENPAGDAVYGYMGVLWVITVIYLYQRYRHDN